MLRGRTVERLVGLQSLVESGAAPEEVAALAYESMGEKTLVDALQHPDATLRILTGDTDGGTQQQEDHEKLLMACGGDAELANDLLHSAGRNVAMALQLVGDAGLGTSGAKQQQQQQQQQKQGENQDAVVDLTDRETSDLDTLAARCGGDRELARDIYENAGKDLGAALALLS